MYATAPAIPSPTGIRIFLAPSATLKTSSFVAASNVKIVALSHCKILQVSEIILLVAKLGSKLAIPCDAYFEIYYFKLIKINYYIINKINIICIIHKN